MKRTSPYVLTLFVFIFASFCLNLTVSSYVSAAEKEYDHLMILGDPHLPGKNFEGKKQVLENINSSNDVDAVVAVGDITESCGTTDEYVAAKGFFSKLKKPLFPITGNHDFIYGDSLNSKGKRNRASSATRQLKLDRFRETFGLQNIYYSKEVGRYRLIFLSIDSAGQLAELSQKQLDWLSAELKNNRRQPTIIFCHAPLAGTLRDYNKNANAPNFII